MRSVTFKAGGALTDGHTNIYIERQADRDVLSHILMMDYLLVIEPRQQGKTSLINHVVRHPGVGDCAFVYIDVTSPNRSSEEAWYGTLCPRILKQLSVLIPDTQWPDIPRDSTGWRNFLYQVAVSATRSKQRIVIELDEIGAITFPGNTEFFTVLRDIYNSRQAEPEFRQITFLLAGAFHPRNLIKDDRISPFNIAQRVRLPDFTKEQVLELVQRGGWTGGQAESLSERIHYWTDGQPYLTQLLCTYLRGDAALSDVDASVERLRREDENHIPPMFEKINSDPNFRKYLDNIRAGKRIKFYPQENSRQAALELIGVLKADSSGYCTIRNRIYEAALAGIVETSTVSVPASYEVNLETRSNESLALIMKGGSVKGLAYVGALKELEKHYIFNWFVGTSAGAIAAVLLAAGYTSAELEKILSEKNFLDFLDARFYQWPFNLWFYGGLFPADTFMDWLDHLLAYKLDSPTRVRLEDLPHRVTVYATRRDQDALVFDSRDPATKGIYASFAVRCSMAIPLVFMPQRDQGLRVLDGGARNNFPVLALLNSNPGTQFLGLYLGSRTYEGNARKERKGFFVRDLLSMWMESTDREALRLYAAKTVIIDPRPITTLSFRLTNEEKSFLIEAGRASALHYLARHTARDQSQDSMEISEADAIFKSVGNKRQILAARRRLRKIIFGASLALTGLIVMLVWRFLL
jgi:predicted acylesterase/phospholipase RssA